MDKDTCAEVTPRGKLNFDEASDEIEPHVSSNMEELLVDHPQGSLEERIPKIGMPPIATSYYIGYKYTFVALAPFGYYWRQMRKICLSEALNAKKLELFEQAHAEERCHFISRLKVLSETGKPVVLRHHLARHTLSITSRMLFRDECYEDVKMDELHAMVDEWFVLAGAFNIGDWMS
ncbi:hypothetical protein ACS0TY_027943 [Phlomoides rotata]